MKIGIAKLLFHFLGVCVDVLDYKCRMYIFLRVSVKKGGGKKNRLEYTTKAKRRERTCQESCGYVVD